MLSLSLISFLENIVDAKLYGFFGFGKPLLENNFILYWIITAALALVAYLLGSLNFAIVISRLKYHDDIRKYGSKNAGFTNMKRVYGMKSAVLVILGDILKGVFSVLIPLAFIGEDPAYIAGLACVLGHCFPVYYGFKGGKGVATTAAMILVLEPLIFLLLVLIFVIMTATTKYLSVGSISAAILYPVLLIRLYNFIYGNVGIQIGTDEYVMRASIIISAVSIFLGLFVVFNHRSNITRIWKGTENKFYLKQKPILSETTSITSSDAHDTDTNNK